MCLKVYLLCIAVWSFTINNSNGCEMNGVNNWMLPEEVSILDVYRGIVFSATTTDIQGIGNVNFEGGLNSGPYLDISLENSVFVISTNDAFELYEENETAEIISVTINFSCTGGSSRILVFEIGIEDTNNNDPEYKPINEFEFIIVPPVLPGYVITDCISDMMVRDIDLTTERIDFEIEENPYFTIEYDGSSSTTPKEFKAVVRTTNLIRSLPDPITLRLSATDVDRTNDPPRTTYATIRIAADSQFQFPEEPLFSQPFYLADYTDDHQLVLTSPISLRQGYDDLVQFSLSANEGYTDNFVLSVTGNQVNINVILPLSLDMVPESQIYIVVNAEREFTSGASATVIVQLPEEVLNPVVISFSQPSYEGQLDNGVLQIPQIILLGDTYGDDLNLDITGAYASYFTLTRQVNAIEIRLLGELPPEVYEKYLFLILTLQASYPNAISGHTTVVLEVVKLIEPQVITPIFEQAHYAGEYSLEEGLTFVEVIQLSEGFDGSITFSLEGDDSQWFGILYIDEERLSLTVIDEGIQHITGRSHLVFTIVARRTESVYGRATIIVSLNGDSTSVETSVLFDKNVYTGSIQSDQVQHEAITLTGYTGTVINILGEYSALFVAYITDTTVYVQASGSVTLPTDVSYIVLELQAGDVSSVLILDVIHAGDFPPETSVFFDKNVYTGTVQSYQVQHEAITLTGYQGTVINILGEYSALFVAYITDTTVYVQASGSVTLPTDVSYIVLELQAADVSSVLILDIIHAGDLPPETSVFFDKNVYTGTVQSDQVQHEAITLTGYQGTVINILGEYSALFVAYITDTTVYVRASGSVTLPTDVSYIVLELQAADVSSVLILDVIRAGDLPPETSVFFDKNIYTGTIQSDQVQHEAITLTGYQGTVINILGEYSALFVAYITDTTVYVQASGSVTLPTDVSYIVLELQAGEVSSLLILDVIHAGDLPPETSVFFDKNIYTGTVQSDQVQHEAITLTGYQGTVINILGEYSALFVAYITDTTVYVQASGSVTLPTDVSYIVLELQAGEVSSLLILDVIHAGDLPPETSVFFDKNIYTGTIQSDQVQHEAITLTGYQGTVINILGEYSALFVAYITDTTVYVQASGSVTLPTDVSYIVLELQAGEVSSLLILDVIHAGDLPPETSVFFDKNIYTGTVQSDQVQHEAITLTGYQGTVINILGEYSALFVAYITDTTVYVQASGSVTLPTDVSYIVLELQAGEVSSLLILDVIHAGDLPPETSVFFDKNIYTGTIQSDQVQHEAITLTGYQGTVINILGEYSALFVAYITDTTVYVQASGSVTLPTDVSYIVLELQAGEVSSLLILDVIHAGDLPPETSVFFDKNIYTGTVQSDQVQHEAITLTGYQGTVINILGEYSALFVAYITDTTVYVQASGSVTLPTDVSYIVLELQAGEVSSLLILDVIHAGDLPPETSVFFDKNIYTGTIQSDQVQHEAITLTGYQGTVINILGEYSALFVAYITDTTVYVQASGSVTLPTDVSYIVLELQAGEVSSLLILDVIHAGDLPPETSVFFDKNIYTGTVQSDQVQHEAITLTGYQGTVINILGEYSALFVAYITDTTVYVQASGSVILPTDVSYIVLELRAADVSTVLILDVIDAGDSTPETNVFFDKNVYSGIVQSDQVQHEAITLTGYQGTDINILGEHSALFVAYITDIYVYVQASGSVTLPTDISYIVLELRAADVSSVLILDVIHADIPVLPSVTFSSSSYIVRVDISQTGLVGQVLATADNGEVINYSLVLNSIHLEERLAVNNEGELRLSAPAYSGVYVFQVLAITAITRVTAAAQVQLTVDAITNCGAEDNIVVPPLIVIDRDEEQPHQNLVVLDRTAHEGCWYTLSNHWPVNQNWLYVDENGLHTTAIDREHESIAFMALSQIQVELILQCESDASGNRKKRSLDTSSRLDWLGPYYYGSKQWLLADTILYNSRRSFVNLIVNDINDNEPIFVGKENEPIVVGYPVPELEETVLPRALAQLKATDADIGENAALMYWSDDPILAVSPTTGFVHVRDIEALQDNALLTVYATDRNGAGLTGSIQLIVKLLDMEHIAVMTVRDAFLENEEFILANLSNAVGYNVNVLRSVVISADAEEDGISSKRQVVSSVGASLQLYVYGLNMGLVPVPADILSSDINDAVTAFNIASTSSLEDFLQNDNNTSESNPIIQESDIGFMVATIVLSILLFILVVAHVVWYYLKRRTENYEEFSDKNSLVSQTDSLSQQPKPEIIIKPKLDIEELKRSERRLQDMLDAPIENVTVEPMLAISTPVEAVLDMSPPDVKVPMVIQSIDKLKDVSDDSEDDEFGEIKRKKSVVTFNENVEKIIHVEDSLDRASPDLEIYEL